MKIGFDAKRAVQNFTGLGNYSRYVIEALAKYAPENEYVLFAPKKKNTNKLNFCNEYSNISFLYPTNYSDKKLSALWRIWSISKNLEENNIDIYHGLSNELPLSITKHAQIKSVVTIHDVIFRKLPHCYKFIDRNIYDYKFRKACENANAIIAVSECTKKDIISDYNIDPDKVSVIYQGCDKSFSIKCTESEKNTIRSKYNLPDNYVLSVGSIEERKNAMLIVQAMTKLDKDLHVVLVGKHTEYTNKIISFAKKNNLSNRLHIFSCIEFNDLPAIYQMARTFCFPSLYEGFGIPILEALYSEIPVIGATGSCLEEAGGKHSFYVNPVDSDELAHAIEKTLCEDIRNEMITQGLIHAKTFSQERLAKQTIEIYKKL